MPCYHPRAAWRGNATGKLYFGAPRGLNNPNYTWCPVPCTKCIGCIKTNALHWAHRCYLELQQHPHSAWAGLTYDGKNVPLTLSKRDTQLFFKRLRSKTDRPLRYFTCGEYGSQRGRPHYHSIIFGLSHHERALVDEAWGLGRTSLDPVTSKNIKYTVGYTEEKYTDQKVYQRERIAPDGTPYTWQPPFREMSRRPGLGSHARAWPQSWKEFAVLDGQKIPVSRYLHEAWRKQATEEQIEELREHRRKEALKRDTSPERLRDGEIIAKAKHQLALQQRKLR